MPKFTFTSPDGKNYDVEGPEGATQDQAFQMLQQSLDTPQQAAPTKPESNMLLDTAKASGNLIAGTVEPFLKMGTGLVGKVAGDVAGLGAIPLHAAGLIKTLPERVQAGVGDALTYKPMSESGRNPGNLLNSIPEAIGHGIEAIRPSQAQDGSTFGGMTQNAAREAVPQLLGIMGAKSNLGQILKDRVTAQDFVGKIKQAQNVNADAALKAAREAGLSAPPSALGAGVVPRLLEGISGPYKTAALSRVKNEPVFNSLARKYINLPDDTPLTTEVTQSVSKAAYEKGYVPVKKSGNVATDMEFNKQLDSIVNKYESAARSFPNAISPDVTNLVNGYRTGKFDAGDAIDATSILRTASNKAYAAGDNAVGLANKELAKALENQIERHLSSKSDASAMLQDFKDARKMIAKAHTVGDSIRQGTHSVDPMKFAARLQAGKPLDAEGRIIGEFANNPRFRSSAEMVKPGDTTPISAIDFGLAGPTGILSMLSGAGAGLALVPPAARISSRYGILSKPAQDLMARRNYGASGGARLSALLADDPILRAAGAQIPNISLQDLLND